MIIHYIVIKIDPTIDVNDNIELYILILLRKFGWFNNVSSIGGGEDDVGNITWPL